MTTLRDAVAWCCRLAIPWTAEDVAEIAGVQVTGARAYLANLAKDLVVVPAADGHWQAGDREALRAWRRDHKRTVATGNRAEYRRGKRVRDRLIQAEIEAREGGRITSQTGTDAYKHKQTIIRSLENGAEQEADVVSGIEARPMARIAEAAALLDLHPFTIQRWCRDGRIQGARRVGRDWRVPVSWVQEQTGSKGTA